MADTPLLTHEAPPRELGTPLRGFARMTLAILVDQYGEEAITRALEDIRASKKARADG